jgi:hypothetical protein
MDIGCHVAVLIIHYLGIDIPLGSGYHGHSINTGGWKEWTVILREAKAKLERP